MHLVGLAITIAGAVSLAIYISKERRFEWPMWLLLLITLIGVGITWAVAMPRT